MKAIYLIRHAQNDWVGDRLAGRTPGVHLNDEGKRQAEALAARLGESETEFHALYSSPIERARETAGYLAEQLELNVQIAEGVGEVEFGDWTGRKIEELQEEDVWSVVQHWPSGMRFPNGEAMRTMQNRAVDAIYRMADTLDDKQRAIVVSHSDVIKAIVAHFAGVHFDLFQRLVVSTASISIIGFTETRPFIVRLNDTAHVPTPVEIDDASVPEDETDTE